MQKLARNYELVFLLVVRTSSNFAPHARGVRGRKKEYPSYLAVSFFHGMTEGQKRKINKGSGSKKDLVTVRE